MLAASPATFIMTDIWNQHTRRTLLRYDESLLRLVAHKLPGRRLQAALGRRDKAESRRAGG